MQLARRQVRLSLRIDKMNSPDRLARFTGIGEVEPTLGIERQIVRLY